MDGIECSIISKSELERTLRIDSEFYQNRYLIADQKMRSLDYESLVRYVDVSDGNHAGISDKFTDEGVPYYRGQDSGTFFIENSNPICIDKDSFNMPIMRRSHLKKNDVLLSIVGTIGAVSLVYSNKDATCSCKLAILRPKNTDNAELLAVFLNSKYGQMQIARYTRGAVQKGLILEDMDQLIMPEFREDFRNTIRSIVMRAFEQDASANVSISDAQTMLSDCLNMGDIGLLNMPIAVKKLSESLLKSGRLDAEYYQPKYDALFEALSCFNCKPLGGGKGIVRIKKSIEPGSEAYLEEGIPFVRVSDVNKYGIAKTEVFIDHNTVQNIESLYPKKDTILFSKDGSVGIAYKVENDSKFVTSGALLHLIVRNTKEVLPDYLTLVLNSPVVQLQAERDSNGAIIQHWKPSEIEQVVIPILDMPTQERIAVKVQESFALRRKSKELLEYAKHAVEMAIEQGETIALNWLNSIMESFA